MKTLLVVLSVLSASAQPVTFNRDIAPLVFHYCAECHRPGEAGPFPLLNYQDVRKHAAQIVAVTQRRYMPPWLPQPGYGAFSGARRLSDAQLRLIEDWVRQGAPEGRPADLPPAPHFTNGWQMGTPDLVVRMPEPYRVPASGSDVFRNFVLPVRVDRPRYVRALELRPGNKRVVHHANIWVDHRQSLRKRDHQDGQPGFSGLDMVSEALADSFEPDSHFLFWKPGSVIEPDPPDMSWRLDPGTDLILNLHLQPTGKEETIQPSVGFYFTDQPPNRFPMLVQLEHDGAIDIPPGDTHFEITDHLKLPVGVRVLAIYPHAHYLGKVVEAWATLPGGTRRWLIRIPDWDINWQAVYRYRTPVALPRGTTVEMRITYDNSASNPRNPSAVPRRVRTGPRSQDEMGHVWLRLLPDTPPQGDPRLPLQEAVMLRRLEKYPGDFAAHCNLGALLEMRADYGEAAAHFEEALRADPDSATAHNGLGATYQAQGRLPEAIRQYREALRIDPAHYNARWNLARALVAASDLTGAEAELKALLRLKPDDFDVHVSLGAAYYLQHRYDESILHYREAVRIKPSDPRTRTDLGGLLAVRGDFAGAIREFEEALRLDPKDETARNYLARARRAAAARRVP